MATGPLTIAHFVHRLCQIQRIVQQANIALQIMTQPVSMPISTHTILLDTANDNRYKQTEQRPLLFLAQVEQTLEQTQVEH